jgi:hypothetical protein
MVNKYRDVIRMTLFGRHDKNLNDTTSIYQGYDRYQQTTTGGGVTGLNFSNYGTVGFSTSPNVYLSNSTNTNLAALTSTLSNTVVSSPIASLNIVSGGANFTGAPNLFIFGGGNPTTNATATCTQNAGSVNTVTLTNAGVAYTSVPSVAWYGGGIVNITPNITTGLLSSFTITVSPSFTTPPTIVITGGGGITQTTTCTLNNNLINTIALPTNTNYPTAPNIYILGGTGQNALIITATMYNQINNVLFYNNTIGAFQSQPTISYNGGGIINITPQMNGGNTIVTGFNITNGGYTGCFSAAPTIVLSGANGYATCTCTITNGAITAINLPVASGNNLFTAAPTVSVYGGGLPTSTASLNPYSITVGGNSLYQNIKRLRFDLNQEFQSIKIANGAVIFLEFIRMPALSNISTCYKNLRVIGAQNITVFDSTQGTTGNPILFTCEGGNTATNYFLSNTEYSRLPVPPNFLNRGYIEFELDTVLTAANNGGVFTALQLNDLIIKIVIAEPDLNLTQDNNLAPEYNKEDFQIQRVYNKQPFRR